MKRSINIEKFREKLLRERERIESELLRLQKEANEVDDDEVKDVGDMSTSYFSQEMIDSLGEKERKILSEIELALKRIDEGTYGVCERCGGEIEEERLEIKPYARYCVKCREKLEKKGLIS